MATNRQKHIQEVLKQADIERLLSLMNELEGQGRSEVISSLSGELTEAKKKAAVSRVQQAVVLTDGKVKEWLVPAISTAYVAGMNATQDFISKFGFYTGLGKVTVETLKSVSDMRPHLEAVNSLLSDAYLDFGSGMTGFVKGVEHTLNDTLKRQIQSKLAIGRLTGEGIREIKKEIVEQLSARGFQVLLDRGGHQWTLQGYSEMLARTHIIRTNTEATVNRGTQLGIDVYEVSTHGAVDRLCAPQEGKLYSVSGQNYPRLTRENTPPFHPNCKHTLLARPDLDR